ncbi:MAG: Gfo/Idh/MocA family oxidoreductase [Clostridia bacterium]|nr:Gfo/Idh/MocA family oxidoreductase [Clostridia bacterium]
MKDTFYVALTGCGAISAIHLAALAAMPEVKIVALCDVKKEKAEAARDTYAPSARVFTDTEEMLDACPDLYALHVTLPHYLHVPAAVSALKRNINVFLEKPVGISEEDIARLTEAERNSRGKLCVCFQNRFNETTKVMDALAEQYGEPLGCRAFVNWARSAPYYTESGWRGFYRTEGGGVMINQAIHTLDLLLRYLGKPVSLSATCANHHLKDVIEVEDSCEATLWFASGAVGNFYATTSFCQDMPVFLEIVFKDHIVSLFNGQVFDNGSPVAKENVRHETTGKACWGQGHSLLIGLFYEALEKGLPMPVTLDSAALSLRVLLSAFRSKGNIVTL